MTEVEATEYPVTWDDDLRWYIDQVRTYLPNPEPRRYTKPLTYAPKIGPVLRGDCSQTIREFNPNLRRQVQVGDELTFHGWKDRPRSYWSKWRIHVTVTEIEELHVEEDGFTIHRHDPEAVFTGKWDSPLADYLAQRDFIDPPTGLGLRKVLEKLNDSIAGKTFLIFRWDPEENLIELHPYRDVQEDAP